MTIDIEKLKVRTQVLKDLIEKYKSEINEELECFDTLNPIFKNIESDLFLDEYNDDPCGRNFTEGTLGQYSDLENAYSDFLAAASGVDEDKLQNFFDLN